MYKSIHFPGLNGIRAIAALAVVVSHTFLLGPLLGLPAQKNESALAGFGVTIFFSLSGFLITYLLLTEKKRFGRVNIRAFYQRRILRIWPLYYFYLAVALFTVYYFGMNQPAGSIYYYIFLCANVPFIAQMEISLLGHYWSLGVEEQFYVFWPWLVSRINDLLKFLVIFIGVFLLLKIGFRFLDARTSLHWPYLTIHVTRFECMAIGALGAVLYIQEILLFRKWVFHPVTQVLAWLSILLMVFEKFHFASVVDHDIVAGITVILIMNVAMNPRTLIGLENRFFDFLGKISFGIYVYHPLVLFLLEKLLASQFASLGLTSRYIAVFACILAITIFVSWLSYELFEKRFLKLKLKFTPVPSMSDKFH